MKMKTWTSYWMICWNDLKHLYLTFNNLKRISLQASNFALVASRLFLSYLISSDLALTYPLFAPCAEAGLNWHVASDSWETSQVTHQFTLKSDDPTHL